MVARAVARVPSLVARAIGVVARAVARGTQDGCSGVAMRLLGYLGWLLGCC